MSLYKNLSNEGKIAALFFSLIAGAGTDATAIRTEERKTALLPGPTEADGWLVIEGR